MKKYTLTSIILSAGLGLSSLSAATLADAANIDVAKVCDVKANGIEGVLKTAAEYNALAKKLGVEFKRKGVTTSQYITDTEAAAKTKAKEVILKYKKKGKVKKHTFATTYAAWRACSFAVRAVQQVNEAEKTWRLAVPGDGFKF